MRTAAVPLLVTLMRVGCGSHSSPGDVRAGQPPEVLPYTEGERIAWDFRTLMRPFDGPASYRRMIRLRNGDLLLSVESQGAAYVLLSRDDGASWSAPIEVASPRDGGIAAVPSLLQLESGTVIMAINRRPPMDNTDPAGRFGIEVAASTDDGRTWQERATVFQAGARSTEGWRRTEGFGSTREIGGRGERSTLPACWRGSRRRWAAPATRWRLRYPGRGWVAGPGRELAGA